MSTVKSNADHLTLNADGASKDIKFQANGVEKASISSTGNLTCTGIDFGDWTITESSGVMYFATGGTNKAKLDASGNLTVVGDVTAYGTI